MEVEIYITLIGLCQNLEYYTQLSCKKVPLEIQLLQQCCLYDCSHWEE